MSNVPASGGADAGRLRGLLAGMTDGVMMLDSELRLVEWNALFPKFTGVPEEALRVGLPIEEILRAQAEAGEFGEVDVEAEVARRVALFRTGGSTGRTERLRPNGMALELRRNALPGGGFVTLYTDVTARREAEHRLQEAQKMETVGHLTGGVAHDFNNLLMIILMSLDRARRALDLADLAGVHRALELARTGARRSASLAQRLLAFSRREPLAPRPLDLNTVIGGMEELLRQSLSAADSLEFLPGERLWTTSVDLSGLETSLLNLVVNARDAMPHGGSVTIETANVTQTVIASDGPLPTPGSEFVRLTVADTGTGMPREVAARAAEPLFTTKPPGKGTGLGLYQVTKFATASGGRVEIDSEPGRGTTVRIYLPRVLAVEPTGPSEPGLHGAGVARGRGECVLVVENEPDIMTFVVEELTELGYRALGAVDASSALTLLESTPDVSVLLTDLGLPGIDGQQLAGEALRRWPDLVVIYASGGPKGSKAEAEPAKAGIPLVLKPYSAEEVGCMIRSMLDRSVPTHDAATLA